MFTEEVDMGTKEPQVLCISYSQTFKKNFVCFSKKNAKTLEFESWNNQPGIHQRINDSPLRFDVIIIEECADPISSSEKLVNTARKNYRSAQILLIEAKGEGFIINSKLPPPFHKTKLFNCEQLMELVEHICKQFESQREQPMLENLHKLSVDINSKKGLKEILNYTCQTAVNILEVDHSGFVIFEKHLKNGHIRAEYPPLYKNSKIKIQIENSILENRLVFQREIINIEDINQKAFEIGDQVLKVLNKQNIQSVLIVPVILNNKVIASFSLDMIRRKRRFYKDEVDFCKKLAAHVALAIGNTERLKEIATLNEIGFEISKLSTEDDIKKIAQIIQQHTSELIDTRNFFLLYYDRELEKHEILFHQDKFDNPKKISANDLHRSMAQHVCNTLKEPKLFKKPEIQELINQKVIDQVGHMAEVWLGAPLIARGEPLGIMVVQNYEYQDAFDEHDLKILTTIASQAAIAIDNFYLYQNLNTQMEQTKLLQEATKDMVAESPDLKKLLGKIVDKAVEISKADAGQIIFHDQVTKKNKVVVTHNMDILKDLEIQAGHGMVSEVLAKGKGLYTNDYFNESYAAEEIETDEYKTKIKGMVQVPLRWNNETIGVLAMSSKPDDKRNFNEKDVKLLEHFAQPAAASIGIAHRISFQQAILQNSPEAIIAINKRGKITEFNRSSERIMDTKKDFVMGKSVTDFYSDGLKEARKIKSLLKNNEELGEAVRDHVTSVKRTDGEEIQILFSGTILRDALNQEIGSIGMMRSLREIKGIDTQYRLQQNILAYLEAYPIEHPFKNRQQLQIHISQLLKNVCDFLNPEYIILFASLAEKETVLQPLAWQSLGENIVDNLPHLNWKKAGLMPETKGTNTKKESEADIINSWKPNQRWRTKIMEGIKGELKNHFSNIAFGVPVRLADTYRSVLVFGPLKKQSQIDNMETFVKNIALTIGLKAMSWLQALNLQAKNMEAEKSTHLLVHRTRMHLQHIIGKFGAVKRSVEKDGTAHKKADEGEKITLNTDKVIKKALTSPFAEMEREDFNFESYSLPAFIHNIVSTFEEQAQQKNREIEVDERIDNLSYADIDPANLAIALGNIIENALKYSYPHTKIQIFTTEYDSHQFTIEVRDIGEDLPQQARENLAEPGKRWVMTPRTRGIEGTGFGLWEASVIVAAHGGKLDFSSYRHTQRGHVVRVWFSLPFKQEIPERSN
jgi:PAS domain S-box-containing protein